MYCNKLLYVKLKMQIVIPITVFSFHIIKLQTSLTKLSDDFPINFHRSSLETHDNANFMNKFRINMDSMSCFKI